jgi:hypothetical protein
LASLCNAPYAPFCLVVDWVAAAILVVLLAVGVDFHH